jgi:hypothetical protein
LPPEKLSGAETLDRRLGQVLVVHRRIIGAAQINAFDLLDLLEADDAVGPDVGSGDMRPAPVGVLAVGVRLAVLFVQRVGAVERAIGSAAAETYRTAIA